MRAPASPARTLSTLPEHRTGASMTAETTAPGFARPTKRRVPGNDHQSARGSGVVDYVTVSVEHVHAAARRHDRKSRFDEEIKGGMGVEASTDRQWVLTYSLTSRRCADLRIARDCSDVGGIRDGGGVVLFSGLRSSAGSRSAAVLDLLARGAGDRRAR